MKRLIVLAAALTTLHTASARADLVLHASRVAQAPQVDGVADGPWANAPSLTVQVERIPEAIVLANREKQKGKYAKQWEKTDYTKGTAVELKAVYTDQEVFFLARWQDPTRDDQHKPWKWKGDQKLGEYAAGSESEDRIAFRFPISGEFSANMLAGIEGVHDVWQWKAARSNPAGLIHDKIDRFARAEPKGTFSTHYTVEGKEVYLSRPDDGGVTPYRTDKIDPFLYRGDLVLQYVATVPDASDAADVKAKGVWADGYWLVEIGRKLVTGHPDTDAVFDPGKGSTTAVAVFDHAGDHFHAVSGVIQLVFDK
ncbi:MAG: hypothetical protein HY900_13495 [Deltaproteobacteria bacterium]|nr:hypothetical protein [Deltaproteobacteria bacterium]